MILYEAVLMGVWVRVGLPVVAVFVLVLNVFMIMQDVRVRMRHIPVRVLVCMLRGHSAPFLTVSIRRGPRTTFELNGPPNRCYTPSANHRQLFAATELNASTLQLTNRRNYLSLGHTDHFGRLGIGSQGQVILRSRDQLVGQTQPRLAEQVHDRSAELPVTTTAVQHPRHGHRSGSIPRRD